MALILRRQLGQKINIGSDIAVKIVGLDADGSVRLGITAPKHVRVLRDELEPLAAAVRSGNHQDKGLGNDRPSTV